MPDQPSARIFISYSRRDGAEFATDVRRQLEGKNFTIWQDLVALEGGRDWWSQIDAALRSDVLQHFVLVVTPAALESEVVRDEIRLARQEGKRISPVKGPGLCDLSKVPRRIGQLYDLDLGEHRTTLQRVLELPSTAKRVPMMVERPPADFVPRPAEFETLKRLLLDPASKDGVALRGTTGYGKTTLAKALAYDPDIEDAFFDGMLWVELGQLGRGHIVNVIADLIALLTGKPREFNTIDGARTALGEALSKLHILLVIDDVWHRADLMPFLHGGPKTARLITTRFAGELPDDVAVERIAAMKGGADGEAWQLLASGLPKDQVVAQKAELVSLAGRCHNWPQALRLANGFLRSRMGLSKHGEWGRSRVAIGQPASLAAAIKAARDGLDAKSITAMDPSAVRPLLDPRQRYDQRHYSVAAGMELNLTLLDNDSRVRFCDGSKRSAWMPHASDTRQELPGLLR